MTGTDYIAIGAAVALLIGLVYLVSRLRQAEREAAATRAAVIDLEAQGAVDRRIRALADLDDDELAAETDRILAEANAEATRYWKRRGWLPDEDGEL